MAGGIAGNARTRLVRMRQILNEKLSRAVPERDFSYLVKAKRECSAIQA